MGSQVRIIGGSASKREKIIENQSAYQHCISSIESTHFFVIRL